MFRSGIGHLVYPGSGPQDRYIPLHNSQTKVHVIDKILVPFPVIACPRWDIAPMTITESFDTLISIDVYILLACIRLVRFAILVVIS
jgi:hypothetical protein